MEAVAIGSLFGAGTATAGTAAISSAMLPGFASLTSAAAATTAGAGIGLGTIVSAASLGFQAFSMFSGLSAADQSFDANIEASRAQLEAAKVRAAETDLQAQRERTAAALEEAERQRRARRILAEQRAKFAGLDISSGTPVAIQEATAGEINRESRLAELASQDVVSTLDARKTGQLAVGSGQAASTLSRAQTNRSISRSNALQQGSSLLRNTGRFLDTL